MKLNKYLLIKLVGKLIEDYNLNLFNITHLHAHMTFRARISVKTIRTIKREVPADEGREQSIYGAILLLGIIIAS